MAPSKPHPRPSSSIAANKRAAIESPRILLQPEKLVVEPVVVQPPQVFAPPTPAEVVSPMPEPAPFGRTWTSADGKFSTTAEFAGAIGDQVKLRKSDGTVVTLKREQLSDADRLWLYERARSRAK